MKSSVWVSVGCSISVRHFQTENVCLCLVVAGVLETGSEEDRDAIKKAKILYSSCMNESKAVYKGARVAQDTLTKNCLLFIISVSLPQPGYQQGSPA